MVSFPMKPIRYPLYALVAAAAAFAVARADDAGASSSHAKAAEPLDVSHGQEVKLADFLVPGKITVFDFYSHYCPPCMAEAPLVRKLHETRQDLAVVDVDINRPGIRGIDWESPVAKEFQLDSIPHFKVYDAQGKLMAEGDEARALVDGWEKAGS
jgi:thiol-disulfide isomerase/thioredoxin